MFRKFLLATAAAAAMASAAFAEEVKIGVVSAQTGILAIYDAPFLQGVQMYAEEANAKGGLNGKDMVTVIARDDRSDVQQTAVLTGELLASEKLNLFITSSLAPQAIASGTQSLAKGLLTVHSIASQPTIPLRLGEGSYLVMMSDAHMGGTYAKFATEDLKAKTAYILTSDFDPYTEFLPIYFQEKFEQYGSKVVGHGTFAYDQQDFTTIIADIKALPTPPDVIMSMTMDADFPVFINQLRAAGVTSTYLGPDILDQPSVKALGKVVDGVYYVTMAAPESGPEAAAFIESYAKKFGNADSAYPAMVGYSFMREFEAAVAAAGTTDPAAIRAAFGKLKGIKTEIGDITYDGFGQLPNVPVHIMQIKDGKGVYVKSIKLTTEELPTPRK
jgi:branched-chain amino acid transport system substrate-binding protein